MILGGPIISPLKAYHHFPNTSRIPRIMHISRCLRIFPKEILLYKISRYPYKGGFFFSISKVPYFFLEASEHRWSHKEEADAKLSLFCIIPCIFRCKINFSAKCILICIHGGWNKHIPNCSVDRPPRNSSPLMRQMSPFTQETLTSK